VSIVGGFDVHRRQLTFGYLDTVTGELRRGRVAPADREHLRDWLARFAGQGDVHFALEGCTGWRYVVEEHPGGPQSGERPALTQAGPHR
jgi:transposase